MRKPHALAALLIALFPILAAAQPAPNLVGTWVSKPGLGPAVTLVLSADGTGVLNTTRLTWSASATKLAVRISGDVNTYLYSQNGDDLAITGGDLQQPLDLTRKGSNTGKKGFGSVLGGAGRSSDIAGPAGDEVHPAAAVGVWVAQVTKTGKILFQIFYADGTGDVDGIPIRWMLKDGYLYIDAGTPPILKLAAHIVDDNMTLTTSDNVTTQWGRHGYAASTGSPQAGDSAHDPALLGIWGASDGSVLQFRADGTMSVGKNSHPWQTARGILYIGNGQLRYQVNGATLITEDTDRLTWTRIGPAGPVEILPPGTSARGGKARIDPLLIGSWQADDGTTFQINADGTFVWNGQQFTYTAENNVVTINITSRVLKCAYKVNGDSMQLVVNGNTISFHRMQN